VPGKLEIQPEKDELVTTVELTEVFPEMTIDMGQENSKHQLYLIARQIRSDFRLEASDLSVRCFERKMPLTQLMVPGSFRPLLAGLK
jgi:hypothetical protein